MYRNVTLALLLAAALATTEGAAQPAATPTTGVPWNEAKPQDTQKATIAYKQGMLAFRTKQWDKALTLFRDSYGAVQSPNSRLMIVRVLAEQKEYLAAYNEAVALEKEARQAAQLDDKYKKTLEAAEVELTAMKSHVGLVTVNVLDAPAGSALVVNEVAIPESKWGQPVAVLPGPVDVVLTTSEGEERRAESISPGQEINVDIGPKPDEVPVAPAPVGPIEDDDGPHRELDGRMVGGGVALGVGIVGFIGFGVFGGMSEAKFNELESACTPEGFCNDLTLQETRDDGQTFQTIANAGLIVGAVGVAAGAGLITWAALDGDGDDEEAAALRPKIHIGPASLSVSGRF